MEEDSESESGEGRRDSENTTTVGRQKRNKLSKTTNDSDDDEAAPNKPTVECTFDYCNINRQLDETSRLWIGRMDPGSMCGCVKCGRFKRTRKMVAAAEAALRKHESARMEIAHAMGSKSRTTVLKIANAAYKIVGDDEVWVKPKREGRRSTLAENQTSGAKHFANTVLAHFPQGRQWNRPDGQLSDERRAELTQLASITCDGTACQTRDTPSTEIPSLCPKCNSLRKLTFKEDENDEDDNVRFCLACDEELSNDHSTGDVCAACKIFWLALNNRMEKRLEPYLSTCPTSTAVSAASNNTSDLEGLTAEPGQLYTDLRAEPTGERSTPARKKAKTLADIGKQPTVTPKRLMQQELARHVDSNEKQYLDNRRSRLTQEVEQDAHRSKRSKRKDPTYIPPKHLQATLDQEMRSYQRSDATDRIGDSSRSNRNEDLTNTRKKRRAEPTKAPTTSREDSSKGPNKTLALPTEYGFTFLRTLANSHPTVGFFGTNFHDNVREGNWKECLAILKRHPVAAAGGLQTPSLIMLATNDELKPCFVARDYCKNGKIKYYQIECGEPSLDDVREDFRGLRVKKKKETLYWRPLWNDKPSMVEWHYIMMPPPTSRTNTDCLPLLLIGLEMYLTLRQRNPRVFTDANDDRRLAFQARRTVAHLEQWTRRRIQAVITGGKAPPDNSQDLQMALTTWYEDSNGNQTGLKSQNNRKSVFLVCQVLLTVLPLSKLNPQA